MFKKTYGDKQREAQQLKKLEQLRARAAEKSSPAPDSPKTDTPEPAEAVKDTRKTGKRVRRS